MAQFGFPVPFLPGPIPGGDSWPPADALPWNVGTERAREQARAAAAAAAAEAEARLREATQAERRRQQLLAAERQAAEERARATAFTSTGGTSRIAGQSNAERVRSKKKPKKKSRIESLFAQVGAWGDRHPTLATIITNYPAGNTASRGIRRTIARIPSVPRTPRPPGGPSSQRGAVSLAGLQPSAPTGPSTRGRARARRSRAPASDRTRATRPRARSELVAQQLVPVRLGQAPQVAAERVPAPQRMPAPEVELGNVAHELYPAGSPGAQSRTQPGPSPSSPGAVRVSSSPRRSLSPAYSPAAAVRTAAVGRVATAANQLRDLATRRFRVPSRNPATRTGGLTPSGVPVPFPGQSPIAGFVETLSPSPVPQEALDEACECEKKKPKKKRERKARTMCKTGTYRQTARGISYRPRSTVPC